MVPTSDDPVDDALLALADPRGVQDPDRAIAPLGGPHEKRFISEVANHRLQASLIDALTRAGREVPTALADVGADDQLVRLRVTSILIRLAPLLDAADIEWLAFKGPMISALMERPELRSFNDLDLLVAADRFADTIDVLVQAGATELNRNWSPYLRHRVGEVPMEILGVSIDLHWHLIGLDHHRRSLQLSPHEMLGRRRLRPLGDQRFPGFDAEDQLLQVALHAAFSGATRLDQLRDLAVVLNADPVDWEIFGARAQKACVARLVAQALDRANRVIGAPIDSGVVDRLGGRLLRLRRRLDGHRVSGLRSFVVVSGRDSGAATTRAAAARLSERAAAGVRLARTWDFTDENARLYYAKESGGPAVRAEYMGGVTEWA